MIKVELKDQVKTKLSIAESGRSLRVFAAEAGISHTYLSQILNGKRQPSATIAYKIAKVLGKEFKDIFFTING